MSMEAGNRISGHGSRNLDLGPDVVSVGAIREPLAWLGVRYHTQLRLVGCGGAAAGIDVGLAGCIDQRCPYPGLRGLEVRAGGQRVTLVSRKCGYFLPLFLRQLADCALNS